jgi:tetratricopeptide (TPR) repeat protein
MAIAEWETSINASWAKSRKTAAEVPTRDDDHQTVSFSIKEPATAEEVLALHKLRRSDPQHYLHVTSEWIEQNPKNSHAYFERHLAWMDLGEPQLALADLKKMIELEPEPVGFVSRGEVYRFLGEYEKAIADYDRAASINPAEWQENPFALLYKADAYARLGDEAAALGCCADLPDDFWTPGTNNTPSGGKADVANKLRQVAAEAPRRRA